MAFININTTRTPKTSNVSIVKLCTLAKRIHDALDNIGFDTGQTPNTPSWTLAVISSLIVFPDASFLHSRYLRLVIPVLSKAGGGNAGRLFKSFTRSFGNASCGTCSVVGGRTVSHDQPESTAGEGAVVG